MNLAERVLAHPTEHRTSRQNEVIAILAVAQNGTPGARQMPQKVGAAHARLVALQRQVRGWKDGVAVRASVLSRLGTLMSFQPGAEAHPDCRPFGRDDRERGRITRAAVFAGRVRL
jgi:hypothetical protein